MNNYKEYKSSNGESLFVLWNGSDVDILEAQKQITANGYIIIEIGCLAMDAGQRTTIKARKVQEDGLKEASL